jgi:hypothetical protein
LRSPASSPATAGRWQRCSRSSGNRSARGEREAAHETRGATRA